MIFLILFPLKKIKKTTRIIVQTGFSTFAAPDQIANRKSTQSQFDMLVSAIVAQANNRVIGRDNQIPWYLPADLAWFKKNTLGHHIIMGRKCFESIGRPLPKRTNIVITRDPFFIGTGLVIARSVDEALEICLENGENEAFIIGGGQIYQQTMAFWDKIYLTDVELDVPDGDVFFPKTNPSDWRQVFHETHQADEKNEFPHTFRILEKTNPSLIMGH